MKAKMEVHKAEQNEIRVTKWHFYRPVHAESMCRKPKKTNLDLLRATRVPPPQPGELLNKG